ncbi:MAG TPA: hypothetical protein VGR62_04760 [Candidatus Binatia bacterium]|jgi:hypothetical protein|nr:hypothetical protein [Candidatus Binatia bacterium]
MTALVALLVVVAATSASAVQVPQQRGKPNDALWDVGGATATPGAGPKDPWSVVCADGDPACDLDDAENGGCRMAIAICDGTSRGRCRPKKRRRFILPASTQQALVGFALPSACLYGPCGTPGIVTLSASNDPAVTTLRFRSRRGSRRGSSQVQVRCVPPDPARRRTVLSVVGSASGSDLDLGTTGNAHNFAVSAGVRLDLCVTGCDATADATCDATVCTAQTFTPTPLLTNGVPVCLVQRPITTSAIGTFDLVSGALAMPLTLETRVHVQTPLDNVCPRCSGVTIGAAGTCDSGARQGQACTVDASVHVIGSNPDYLLSADCPPDAPKLALAFPIVTTLTTGDTALAGSRPCPGQAVDDACGEGMCTADCSDTIPTKGGINQTCCSNSTSTPCFPTAADSPGVILRTGVPVPLMPAWPTSSPQSATGTVLAATFCVPRTTDQSVDILYGLPGPGAVLLPVDLSVRTVIAP